MNHRATDRDGNGDSDSDSDMASSLDLPSTRMSCHIHPCFSPSGPRSTYSVGLVCQDRLPTVSAAQALQDLESDDSSGISTGLPALDQSLGAALGGPGHGGIQKGHVTEIWGPPGAGKTAFGYAPFLQPSVPSLSCAWLLTCASEYSSPPVVSVKAAELSGWVRLACIPSVFRSAESLTPSSRWIPSRAGRALARCRRRGDR